MIKPLSQPDLSACLNVIHRGYETVAAEFGLTEENCPDRGRASLSIEKLTAEFESGTAMFGYYIGGEIVGYLGMKTLGAETCGLEDIVVLPEHRGKGCGQALLNFCKQRAKELGAGKIRLGMIDDNKCLRKWYEANGFVNVGYKKYDSAPFTVGKMECTI